MRSPCSGETKSGPDVIRGGTLREPHQIATARFFFFLADLQRVGFELELILELRS